MTQNIQELEKTLENKELSAKEQTAQRGRLIKEYIKEIEKLSKDNEADNSLSIKELTEKAQRMIELQKLQLEARYREEFLNPKADIKSIFTMLPKSVSISTQKVATCIEEQKIAKLNKKNINNGLEIAKNIGLTVASPVIYTLKFALNQWYIVAGAILAHNVISNPSQAIETAKHIIGL